ncbi:MAG: radical SAM protein [Lachnospiraceae bacterium]|jgi:uncharacterized protein|nr:radical SAM protein [Lachnospiraceae bacterium]
MLDIKPFLFKVNDVHYLYDDCTGIVLPLNNNEYNFIESLDEKSDLDKMQVEEELCVLIKKIKKYGLFVRRKEHNDLQYSEAGVKDYICKEGIKHMCLILTDDCNFRCKYCIFSDHYKFSKHYSDRKMSFDVAKKAVDYYFDMNSVSWTYNPYLQPSIGFYGGEPLLCWDMIVGVVEYVKEKAKDCVFSITTNGYLLDKEKILYMLNNRFSISISLDGSQGEHDRNRVDRAGKGTFQKVYSNIKLLENETRRMKQQGEEPLPYNILITYDNLTKLDEVDGFFRENPWLQDRIVNINKVNAQNTDYYDTQSDNSMIVSRRSQLDNLFEEHLINIKDAKENKFLETLFNGFTSNCANRVCYHENELRGICIPGSHKLAVDVIGNFHICEKINPNYSIGDVWGGLDFKKIAEYISDVLLIFNEKCKSCNIRNVCNMCYVNLEGDGKFTFNDSLCAEVKDSMAASFGLYYSILLNKKEDRESVF